MEMRLVLIMCLIFIIIHWTYIEFCRRSWMLFWLCFRKLFKDFETHVSVLSINGILKFSMKVFVQITHYSAKNTSKCKILQSNLPLSSFSVLSGLKVHSQYIKEVLNLVYFTEKQFVSARVLSNQLKKLHSWFPFYDIESYTCTQIVFKQSQLFELKITSSFKVNNLLQFCYIKVAHLSTLLFTFQQQCNLYRNHSLVKVFQVDGMKCNSTWLAHIACWILLKFLRVNCKLKIFIDKIFALILYIK